MDLKKLFDPKTYKGCKVVTPEIGNDRVDVMGLHGGPLRLRFTRYLDGWTIRQKVVAYLDDEPTPNHAVLLSGQEASPEFRRLFDALLQEAYEQSMGQQMEDRHRRVEQLFAGEAP